MSLWTSDKFLLTLSVGQFFYTSIVSTGFPSFLLYHSKFCHMLHSCFYWNKLLFLPNHHSNYNVFKSIRIKTTKRESFRLWHIKQGSSYITTRSIFAMAVSKDYSSAMKIVVSLANLLNLNSTVSVAPIKSIPLIYWHCFQSMTRISITSKNGKG